MSDYWIAQWGKAAARAEDAKAEVARSRQLRTEMAEAWQKAEKRKDAAEWMVKRLMQWVDSWDPNFVYDEEWPEDETKAKAIIEGMNQ